MKYVIISILLSLPLYSFGQGKQTIEQIQQLIQERRYNEGLKLVDSLIKDNKEINNIYCYKARIEYSLGRYIQSVKSATTALQNLKRTNALYPKILLLRILAYTKLGNLSLAISDNEKLVKTFPTNFNGLLNMSSLYGETNQFTKCIGTLHKALDLFPNNIYIINNLAYFYGQANDFKLSIKYANQGLSFAKDSVWIASLLNSLGFAQAKTISNEKGLKTIRESLEYRPNNAFAYFNIGLIYIDMKKTNKACENFEKAKQLGGINMTFEYIKKYCK